MRSVIGTVADPGLQTQLSGLLDDLRATTIATPADDLQRRLGFLRSTVESHAAVLESGAVTALRQALDLIEHAFLDDLAAADSHAHGLLETGRTGAEALLDRADGIGGKQLDRAEQAGHHLVEDAAAHADDSVQKAIGTAERAAGRSVRAAVEAIGSAAAGIALGAGVALLAGAAVPVVAVAAVAGFAVGLGAWLLTH